MAKQNPVNLSKDPSRSWYDGRDAYLLYDWSMWLSSAIQVMVGMPANFVISWWWPTMTYRYTLSLGVATIHDWYWYMIYWQAEIVSTNANQLSTVVQVFDTPQVVNYYTAAYTTYCMCC